MMTLSLTSKKISQIEALFSPIKPGQIHVDQEHRLDHLKTAKQVLDIQEASPVVRKSLDVAIQAIRAVHNGGTLEDKKASVAKLTSSVVVRNIGQASCVLRSFAEESHKVTMPARNVLLDWHDMHSGDSYQPNSVACCCPPIQDLKRLAGKVDEAAAVIRVDEAAAVIRGAIKKPTKVNLAQSVKKWTTVLMPN